MHRKPTLCGDLTCVFVGLASATQPDSELFAGAGSWTEAACLGAVSNHLCMCRKERGRPAYVQGIETEDLGRRSIVRVAGDLWHGACF